MRDTGVIETSEIFFLFSLSWSTIIIIILTVSVFLPPSISSLVTSLTMDRQENAAFT